MQYGLDSSDFEKMERSDSELVNRATELTQKVESEINILCTPRTVSKQEVSKYCL